MSVTDDHSPPPFRELSPERLRVREEHLLDQIRIQPGPHRHLPRLLPRRGRLLVAAAILVAAVVAAPALAFSTTVREFVGLQKPSPPPFLVATITAVKVHRPRPPALATVTITFTVGENGRRPGSGVPFGSAFSVLLSSKTAPQLNAPLIAAKGSNGYYSVTTLLPTGGIGSIQIGGFGNFPTGTPAVDGEFWLPVNAFRPPPPNE
jgi:hypothetical protein